MASFFDNLKMGLGLKPKTDEYIKTTANTMRKTQGDARADRYLAEMKAKGNLKGSSSKKSSSKGSAAVKSSLTFADEVLKDPSRFLPPSVSGKDSASTATAAQREKDRKDFQRNFEMQSKRRDANPTGQSYQMYGRSVNLEKDPTLLQQGIGGGVTGGLLNYLSGSRPLDPIVNIIDGKPIYEDSKGRTYAYDNIFGMRYDTTGADSLDVLPRDTPQSTDDRDNKPVAPEVVKQPDDPCPKGYMMDPETKQCVLDPFDTAFADPVTTTPSPVVTAGLSPYTQMAPVTLGQLQPTRVAAANPLAMQQANMQQMPQQGLGSLAPVINKVV